MAVQKMRPTTPAQRGMTSQDFRPDHHQEACQELAGC